MVKEEFVEWLGTHKSVKSKKVLVDMASRAKRVENAFKALNPEFSLENEFGKDKGKELLKRLSLEGRALTGTNINLPLNTNQMAAIKASVSWYFKFLADAE